MSSTNVVLYFVAWQFSELTLEILSKALGKSAITYLHSYLTQWGGFTSGLKLLRWSCVLYSSLVDVV